VFGSRAGQIQFGYRYDHYLVFEAGYRRRRRYRRQGYLAGFQL
jgi:hypothetical protein